MAPWWLAALQVYSPPQCQRGLQNKVMDLICMPEFSLWSLLGAFRVALSLFEHHVAVCSLQCPWPAFFGDSSTLFLTFHSSFEDSPCCKECGNRWAPAACSVALNWFSHHTKSWGKWAARGGKRKIAKSWCQSYWRIVSNKDGDGADCGKTECGRCVTDKRLQTLNSRSPPRFVPKKGGWKIERHFLRARTAVGLLMSPFISPLSVVTGILCENFIYIKKVSSASMCENNAALFGLPSAALETFALELIWVT